MLLLLSKPTPPTGPSRVRGAACSASTASPLKRALVRAAVVRQRLNILLHQREVIKRDDAIDCVDLRAGSEPDNAIVGDGRARCLDRDRGIGVECVARPTFELRLIDRDSRALNRDFAWPGIAVGRVDLRGGRLGERRWHRTEDEPGDECTGNDLHQSCGSGEIAGASRRVIE